MVWPTRWREIVLPWSWHEPSVWVTSNEFILRMFPLSTLAEVLLFCRHRTANEAAADHKIGTVDQTQLSPAASKPDCKRLSDRTIPNGFVPKPPHEIMEIFCRCLSELTNSVCQRNPAGREPASTLSQLGSNKLGPIK